MRYLNYLLIISFSGIMLCSCTITKRHFGKGYHIEWRKKPTSSEFEMISFKEIDSTREVDFSKEIPGSEVRSQIEVDSTMQMSETLSEKFEKAISKTNPQSEKKVFKRDQPDEPESDIAEEADRKVYPFTWVMVGIPPMVILSYVLVMQSMYLLGGAGIVVFAFVGLILGIVSLVALKKNPGKYKRTKLTKVFSMICIISGGIITYAAILYFALFKH
jgi:hypothetical protein